MGNANSAVVWGVVLIVLAAAGLVAGAIVFFTRFNRETRRLTEKMCHAGEDGEYRYLAGKLRRHYLLLIPFVTRRNVGRVDRFFTCRQKNAKEKSARGHSDGLTHMLAPCVLAVCLCVICLCGVSFAWFTASESVGGVSDIRTPDRYELAFTVTDEAGQIVTPTGTQYAFTTGKTYTVTLSATGTESATGFCTVTLGDRTYYSEQVAAVGTFTFTVAPTEDTALSLLPKWGISAARNEENKITAGQTLS